MRKQERNLEKIFRRTSGPFTVSVREQEGLRVKRAFMESQPNVVCDPGLHPVSPQTYFGDHWGKLHVV